MSGSRRLEAGLLVVASHNAGKVLEIRALLEPLGIGVRGAGEMGLPEPEETGSTYAENAALKAEAAALASGHPALADDSGFEVAALGGEPGLYSARWAGPGRDFSAAMERVWAEVGKSGSDDRSCRFVCALSLVWPDRHVETATGTIDGQLAWPPRGDKGFGYDPIFVPDGRAETFAETDPEWKHRVSHRARAFEQLAGRCLTGARAAGQEAG